MYFNNIILITSYSNKKIIIIFICLFPIIK